MSNNDLFINPQAPSNYFAQARDDSSQPMTNDDFRKLLMTPAAGGAMGARLGSVRGERIDLQSARSSKVNPLANKKKISAERKEKKAVYAALVKESLEREAELAKKYRDRAKERRELNKGTDEYGDELTTPHAQTTTTSQYYMSSGKGVENADRRRQVIEESKYLGGDLEHTHLVKGLDYALLQKVKAELSQKGKKKEVENDDDDEEDDDDDEEDDDDDEEDDEMKARIRAKKESEAGEDDADQSRSQDEGDDESQSGNEEDKVKQSLKPKLISKSTTAALAQALNQSKTGESPFAFKKLLESTNTPKSAAATSKLVSRKSDTTTVDSEDNGEDVNSSGGLKFKTRLGRSIYRVLFESKQELPKTNELFMPHRMAYIVDLTNEYEEPGASDIPLTSIRSKADCPNNESHSAMTTNDIVINKLTQILAYLRQDGSKSKDGKKLKKKIPTSELVGQTSEPVKSKVEPAADLGIYDDIGDYVPSKKPLEKKSESSMARAKNYFGNDRDKEIEEQAPSKQAALDFIKNVSEKYASSSSFKKPDEKPKEKDKPKSVEGGSSKTPVTVTASNMNMMGFKFDTSDSYSECYPGTRAEEDVNIDSDEEGDYLNLPKGQQAAASTDDKSAGPVSKSGMMFGDVGKKVAPGGFGGPKKPGNEKVEKARLDKEWTKISNLIEKRKTGGLEPGYKKPKY